jgi:hypothetical protein
MKGEFLPAAVPAGYIQRHKTKARKLLEGGKLNHEIELTVRALFDARNDWDDALTAFYLVELHTLVEELLTET